MSQSSIVSYVSVSHRRSLVVLASRRRSRVASVVKRRLPHGPPSCSLVGDIDTWSRESGQGTHAGRGRRGGRPSPAGNARVFSLTPADGREERGDPGACRELTTTQLLKSLNAGLTVREHIDSRSGLGDVWSEVLHGGGNTESLDFAGQPPDLMLAEL